MAEHSGTFFLLTLLTLATVLSVFGMKYFSAAKRARLRAADDGAYRALAEKTSAAQTASAASLASLEADLSDMKTRLAAVEKVLREVE
ncbi:hypothetical protein [Pelagibius sp.]|uniref:hypothetical protein n=1 Tax=Pelagibius sp. TaxID=1931238 RepID=UPI003BAF5C36